MKRNRLISRQLPKLLVDQKQQQTRLRLTYLKKQKRRITWNHKKAAEIRHLNKKYKFEPHLRKQCWEERDYPERPYMEYQQLDYLVNNLKKKHRKKYLKSDPDNRGRKHKKPRILYFIKRFKRKFFGHRTQKKWWVYPEFLANWRYWTSARHGTFHIKRRVAWKIKKNHKLRRWLLICKKVFTASYGIMDSNKITNITQTVKSKKKPNKVQTWTNFFDNQLVIKLIHLKFCQKIAESISLINKGAVWVNGQQIMHKTHHLDHNDLIEIKKATRNKKQQPELEFKLRRLIAKSNYRKFKQNASGQVHIQTLRAIVFTKKKGIKILRKKKISIYNKKLHNYMFSQLQR